MYKKHNKIRGSLVTAIPRAEYMKMSDKSTVKAMFASLCANYEGSKKVREDKSLMLVHQYELLKMKDDESVEEMYSRFQTLVSGLQILKKSYVASDHLQTTKIITLTLHLTHTQPTNIITIIFHNPQISPNSSNPNHGPKHP